MAKKKATRVTKAMSKYFYTAKEKAARKKAVAKKNPSLPKGKFIPCKAIKFNANGSVSIKK